MINLLDKRHLFSKQKENAYVAGEYVFSNSYFESKQNFGRFNLFGKYAGALSPKTYLTLSASTFNANWFASGQVPERAVEQGIITRFGSIDNREGGSTSRSNGNVILTTSLPNGAVIKNQLYYVKYDFNLFSNFTFFLEDSINGDGINQIDDRNIFGYSGSYEKEHKLGNVELTSVLGLGTRNDFTDIALRRSIGREITDTIVSGHVFQQSINGYLDETFRFKNRFSVNAGARLDHFYFTYKDNEIDSLSGNRSIARISPKLNFYYAVNDNVQFFLKSGIGFHSNDARAVVLNHTENSLPKAYGSEIGSEFKLFERMLFNVAVWGLEMESELVYVGDAGVVETSTPTRRVGTDFGMRYQVTKHFFADVDLNYNYGRLVGVPEGENYIPLAPRLTSIGGLTYKRERGLNASLRYRFIDSRPANETNSVTAKGYFLIDGILNFVQPRFEIGVSAENIMNEEWNQAQFDTESRLFNEAEPVSELHYTPGTPFFLKAMLIVKF